MKKLLTLIILFQTFFVTAQNESDFQSIRSRFGEKTTLCDIALSFLTTPYVASTLETSDTERLIVNLNELDCVTFVETCIAFALITKEGKDDFDSFSRKLQQIRYRDGVIEGYESRLHYFSDWIYDNCRKGIIEDKTKSAGGRSFPIALSYMSKHAEAYPRLRNNPALQQKMRNIETEINKRTYHYIPKAEINKREKHINDGDIICFTTSVGGLDISHVAIAYRYKGSLTFIHASSQKRQVIIEPGSLASYCAKNKSNTGIMLLSLR